MSALDESIQGAVARKLAQVEKDRAKFKRNVIKILGRNLYKQLGAEFSEYEREIKFTVKGQGFALTPYSDWFYVEVRPQTGRFGDRELCTCADDLLLFIANHTKKA